MKIRLKDLIREDEDCDKGECERYLCRICGIHLISENWRGKKGREVRCYGPTFWIKHWRHNHPFEWSVLRGIK